MSTQTHRCEAVLAPPADYYPWWYSRQGECLEKQKERQQQLIDEAGAQFGEGCFVSSIAQVFTTSLKMGDRSWIAANTNIQGDLVMGEDSTINMYTVLEGSVTIGSGVRIAPHCVIMAANHGFEDLEPPIFRQPCVCEGIVIEDDVWVGAQVTILDGVRIGAHSVIAAGAVVSRDVAPYSIVGGVPARLIKDRRAAAAQESLRASLEAFAATAKSDWRRINAFHTVEIDGRNLFLDAVSGKPDMPSLGCGVELAALWGETVEGWDQEELIAYLQGLQSPQTGLVPSPWAPAAPRDAYPDWANDHSALYGILSIGYALETLGSAPCRPVTCFDNLSSETLLQALRRLPWKEQAWSAGTWVDSCGTAFYFNRRYHGGSAPLETLFGWLNLNCSPETGLWGDADESGSLLQPVNGFYRLTRGTYAQFGVPLPYPEAAIDSILKHATTNSCFADGRGNCCDVLDIIHPLWLCAKQTTHRRSEIEAVARLHLERVIGHWAPGEGMSYGLTEDENPCLHYTEQWLSTIYLMADLLGMSDCLGYRPRGIHRVEAVGRDLL